MNTATPRERLLRYLRREAREGIPFDLGFNPEAQRVFSARLGGKSEREYFGCPVRSLHPDLLAAKQEYPFEQFYPQGIPEGAFIDEWGICTTERHGLVHVLNPMKDFSDPEELKTYPFPDYSRPACYERARQAVEAWHAAGLPVIIKAERLIFAMGRDLRGYENHLMDYCIDPEFNEALLDRILACQKQMVAGMAATGADILWLSSDVASQTNVFLRPSLYHETVAWRMKALYEEARRVNPEILCAYHCCGNVEPIMEDILDFGIQILNPIQPESLDLARFKEKYGDRLILWGGLSVQNTFPRGTPEDVRAELENACRILGQDGGYVAAPCNEITEDIPWENLVAFVSAARPRWESPLSSERSEAQG